MSLITRIAGVATGLSAVAVIGVAVAQGVPPNPAVRNPALGAGDLSIHGAPLGETGTVVPSPEVPVATLTRQPEPVAAAPIEQPAPVAAAPAQESAPVAAAPEAAPAPEPAQSMGAGPEEQQQPAPPARADRN